MKSFSQLREDIKPAWITSTTDLVFGIGYNNNNPLDGPMYLPMVGRAKDIFRFPGTKAAHFTDIDGAMQVIKMQNKRRNQLSVTTEFALDFSGIHRSGVAMLLEGEIYARTEQDQFTVPSSGGVRWINLSYFESSKIKRLHGVINKFIMEFYTNFAIELSNSGIELSNKSDRDNSEVIEKIKKGHYDTYSINPRIFNKPTPTEKKIIEKYIGIYFKVSEKLLLRYQNDLKQEVFKNLKQSGYLDYDEAVMDNFRVLKIIVDPRPGSANRTNKTLYKKGYFKLKETAKNHNIPFYSYYEQKDAFNEYKLEMENVIDEINTRGAYA